MRFLKSEDGPTSVEYAVLLALIVGMMVSAITYVGSETQEMSELTVDALSDSIGCGQVNIKITAPLFILGIKAFVDFLDVLISNSIIPDGVQDIQELSILLSVDLFKFNELHLKKLLRAYFIYYHTARTHLALHKQCPEPRSVELPDQGTVIAFPHVGGLHHEYRRAA